MSFAEVAQSGIFQRQPFRYATPPAAPRPVPQGIDLLAAGIANADLIPSLDVFLWSLAVAGVKHYGNDFGFFARLAATVRDPSLASLQLTASKADCRRFLKFDRDYGILVHLDGAAPVAAPTKPGQSLKLTRTNSFSAMSVSLGDAMGGVLEEYAKGRFSQATVSLLGEVRYCAAAQDSETQ
jgi:hypothetical protein